MWINIRSTDLEANSPKIIVSVNTREQSYPQLWIKMGISSYISSPASNNGPLPPWFYRISSGSSNIPHLFESHRCILSTLWRTPVDKRSPPACTPRDFHSRFVVRSSLARRTRLLCLHYWAPLSHGCGSPLDARCVVQASPHGRRQEDPVDRNFRDSSSTSGSDAVPCHSRIQSFW